MNDIFKEEIVRNIHEYTAEEWNKAFKEIGLGKIIAENNIKEEVEKELRRYMIESINYNAIKNWNSTLGVKYEYISKDNNLYKNKS